MVAIAAREAEAFATRGYAAFPLILFYGPDEGLASERAEAVARATTGGDPASVIRMDADAVAADPARLAEEAHAIAMFGGPRAIRLRAGARSLVEALKLIIAAPPSDARVIVEAGDLKKGAPLRALIEAAPNAAAVPCYAEEARDLGHLIDATLAGHGLTIAADARAALAASLGQDRRLSRMEVEKLALYCRGRGRVELQDVQATVADAAAVSADAVIDAAFLGRLDALETEARRLFADGVGPDVLLGFALRHALVLQGVRRMIDDGRPAPEAVKAARVHFRREAAMRDQARLWTPAKLGRAVQIIGDAAASTRRNAALAEATAIRGLWSLALAASRG